MTTPGLMRPEPGLRGVLANNPSPMTAAGTITWILGEGQVAVIDPSPPDRTHLAAILGALGPGERIGQILVTHSHRDHSSLARPLAEATGAPVLAFGPSGAGQSPHMARLAAAGLSGGEGVDPGFSPDLCLRDGDTLDGPGWTLTALHTPGHLGNHLCFRWGAALFSGDHVMGWSSSVIAPPDGDMGAYLAALRRLAKLPLVRLYPAHGDPVEQPAARIAALLAHRDRREGEILSALAEGPADATTLAARLYPELAPALRGAAAANVLAHLLDLETRGRVAADAPLTRTSRFTPRP